MREREVKLSVEEFGFRIWMGLWVASWQPQGQRSTFRLWTAMTCVWLAGG